MLEIGVPVQIELGYLSKGKSSLYGSFGLTPTLFTTLNAYQMVNHIKDKNKYGTQTGFLLTPALEGGVNFPINDLFLRVGIFLRYKVNCTTGGFDVYHEVAGNCFFGPKIGLIF